MGLRDLFNVPAEHLRKLSTARVADLVEAEIPRARARIHELRKLYPNASNREIGQRLIDKKKAAAGMVGGITGVFGLASVPADLLAMAWLQLSLITDLATLYGHAPKSERSKSEVVDLLAYANGVGSMARSSPKLLGTLAGRILERGGLKSMGRALPLVAAPLSAYLNNRHIQEVGEETLRHFEGFSKTSEKARQRDADAS